MKTRLGFAWKLELRDVASMANRTVWYSRVDMGEICLMRWINSLDNLVNGIVSGAVNVFSC